MYTLAESHMTTCSKNRLSLMLVYLKNYVAAKVASDVLSSPMILLWFENTTFGSTPNDIEMT